MVLTLISLLRFGSRYGSKYLGFFLAVVIIIAFFFEKNPRIKDDSKKD